MVPGGEAGWWLANHLAGQRGILALRNVASYKWFADLGLCELNFGNYSTFLQYQPRGFLDIVTDTSLEIGT